MELMGTRAAGSISRDLDGEMKRTDGYVSPHARDQDPTAERWLPDDDDFEISFDVV